MSELSIVVPFNKAQQEKSIYLHESLNLKELKYIDMNHDQGISILQGLITRTRAKKLQQTLYTYIQAMVSSLKEILEDVGDLPYMLCKVELQEREFIKCI